MDVFVRRGDSFWYYSQLFNVPLQLITDSNRTINSQTIQIGQRVRIPGFVATQYQIRAGDSLWSIARTRNLPLDTLFLVNPTLNPNRLQIGQMILVPIRITWRLVNGKQPYDYGTLTNDLQRLLAVYPFIETPSIGQSVLGNDIREVVIGRGSKQIHYNGSFHANEWITTPIIMTFLNDYLLSLINQHTIRGLITSPLYEQTTLSVVPMVNPDGVNLVIQGTTEEPWLSRVTEWNNGSTDFSGWKANIRGVDLNDQFPANWDAERERNPKSPGPRDYGGESPLSEPEAIAMADLTRRRDFSRVLAFHTQGEVIYWGYENLEPPESEFLVNEFRPSKWLYTCPNVRKLCWIQRLVYSRLETPWIYGRTWNGNKPIPLDQFDEIYEEVLGIFLLGLYL